MWAALENIGSSNLNTYKWLLKNRHSPWKNTRARAHIWTRAKIQNNNEELTQSHTMQLNTVFEQVFEKNLEKFITFHCVSYLNQLK